jgi:hypothetical protein
VTADKKAERFFTSTVPPFFCKRSRLMHRYYETR